MQVSNAKEPYKRDLYSAERHIFLSILLIVATPSPSIEMPLAIAINWMTLIGLVCACIETQKSHTNTQMYQSPNIYTKEPYKHQPMHLYTYKGKPHQYPQRLRMCQYFSTYTQQSSTSIPAKTLHMSMHLYMYTKETNQHSKRPTIWSLWAQPIAFGFSFLHCQISIDDLVLQVSFTTFS